MKYIDADILSERIKKNQYVIEPMFLKGDDSYYEGENDGYNRILDIIDSLQQEQPSLPSNLDEAANKFAVLYDQGTCDGIAQECFKAGAQWMAKKELECKNVIWLKDDDYDPLDNDWELGSVGLGHKGYYIPYSDLLKLPKEE